MVVEAACEPNFHQVLASLGCESDGRILEVEALTGEAESRIISKVTKLVTDRGDRCIWVKYKIAGAAATRPVSSLCRIIRRLTDV